jgi:mannose-6-phosphate isomerase-like protein (cupin superfamily)
MTENGVRRVVTGHIGQRSAVAGDHLVEPVVVSALPGYSWHRIWSQDQPPAGQDGLDGPAGQERPEGSPPCSGQAHFPPPGGLRFNIYTVPPQGTGPAAERTADSERELERALPGPSRYMETSQDGMHRTPTLDLICVLSGEIWLELDDGETHLRQGDCVVQTGTRHAWRNRGDTPCSMAIVLVGASEAGHGHRDERQ